MFQSTPLQEGRPTLLKNQSSPCRFQSTPLQEGRRGSCAVILRRFCFNPRPCKRGDTRWSIHPATPSPFQSTPLQEGRRLTPGRCRAELRFNPRPCKRGDVVAFGLVGSVGVSIHAPARGATRAANTVYHQPRVSIHAPARGATFWQAVTLTVDEFQSTPLQEGRPSCLSYSRTP